MEESHYKVQGTLSSISTAKRPKYHTPYPKLLRVTEAVRLALIVGTVSTTLPMGAQGLDCPITSPVTVTTSESNSVSCQITATGQLDISNLGASLDNQSGGSLSNDGSLKNAGSLINQYGGFIENSNTLSNTGTLTSYGSLANSTRANVLSNAGTLNSAGLTQNYSRLTNTASGILNNSGRLYSNDPGAEIFNEGLLNNVAGGILSNQTGSLTNTGDLHNYGSLNNSGILNNSANHGRGTLSNQGGGVINNTGTLENFFGIINNVGTLTNGADGKWDNSGDVYNLSGGLLNNYGYLNNDYAYLRNHGTIKNFGTLNSRAALGLYSNPIYNYGTFENTIGATLNVSLINYAGGTLENSGYVRIYAGITNRGNLNNQGVGVLVNENTGLFNRGTLTNDGMLISRNTYVAQSYYYFTAISNSGTLNNNGTLINTGVPTLYYAPTLFNSGTLNNTGTLVNDDESVFRNRSGGTVNNDGTINNTGSIHNAGDFNIAASGSVTGDGSFSQAEGNTIVDGSLSQASISFSGGMLGGQGILASHGVPVDIGPDATLNPGGTVSTTPSDYTGTLTFGSDVNFDGKMTIELAGLTDFDSLDVLGSIDFGLNSEISFDLEDYLPSAGDSLTFVLSESVTGFENITYSFLDQLPGLSYDVLLTLDNDLRLEFGAVPVPAAAWLFGSGLMGMAAVARKRKPA